MSGWGQVVRRALSGSAALSGKHNFRKFVVANKRGTRIQRKAAYEAGQRDWRGRDPGLRGPDGVWRHISEMRPELVVPDLSGTSLRPYVSYRAPEVSQSQLGPQELFNAVYAPKIVEDLRAGRLNETGESLQPSEEERQNPQEAYDRARRTGSDIFG